MGYRILTYSIMQCPSVKYYLEPWPIECKLLLVFLKSVFVRARSITDNMMSTHNLVKKYEKKVVFP